MEDNTIIKEEWKDIKGYEGLYQISNLGRIKHLYEEVIDPRGIKQTFPERVLKCAVNKVGYVVATLRKDGRRYSVRVHRLVALHFIENPNNKPIVDHVDGNKQNNIVTNLRWATNSENVLNVNTYDNFKDKVTKVRKSERIPVCQLDNKYNLIKIFDCADDAAKELDCSAQLIRNCCKKEHKHYKAKGYHWCYQYNLCNLKIRL